MSEVKYTYPLDPDGIKSENVVENERATLTPANSRDFNIIIPRFAPFYVNAGDKFRIRKVGASQDLVEGVDYSFGWNFRTALLTTGKPIYGCIVFNDPSLSDTYEYTYHTIGGELTLDDAKILDLLTNHLIDPRTTTWEKITNKPTEFPASPHLHDFDDMVGQAELIAVLEQICLHLDGAAAKFMTTLIEHAKDYDNPHQVTLAQLGLDDVGTLTPAGQAEAESGVGMEHYMPATRVTQWAARNILPLIAAHPNIITGNPHRVSKSDVGLNSVYNAGFADTLTAMAGASETVYMNPLQTKNLATLIAQAIMEVHEGDWQNPHKVTKEQVLLGNVPNYMMTSDAQALAGNSKDVFTSPGHTQMQIMETLKFLMGTEGDALFFTQTDQVTSVEGGLLVNEIAVASTEAEYTTARARAVTVADSISDWKQIGNSAWTVDAINKDQIIAEGEIDGASLIYEPEDFDVANLTYEVDISSAGAEDGIIGIVLAEGTVNGKKSHLVCYRAAGNGDGLKLFGIGYVADGTLTVLRDTNGGLMWPDGVIDDSRDPVLENQYGTWNQYVGAIKLRVGIVSGVLTANTTNPGGATNIATATITLDLNSSEFPVLSSFSTSIMGFYAGEQTLAKFVVLKRPGARATLIDTRTNTISVWGGSAWAEVAGAYNSYVTPGRQYFSRGNGKLYYADRQRRLIVISFQDPTIEQRLAALEAAINP